MVTVSETIQAALHAYQAGRWVEAEWLCQDLVQQFPQTPAAWQLLGAIAYQTRRLESAINHYQRALALQPQDAESHNNLAVALQDCSQLLLAEQHFQQALRLNPRYATAYFNYGNLLQQQGRLEVARAYYQDAIAADPNYAKAYGNLGHLYRRQGNLEMAETYYRRAINLNPRDAESCVNLANLRQQQGDWSEAIAWYETALQFQPGNSGIYFNLGLALRAIRQPEAALRCYQKALPLGQAPIYHQLALAYQDLNQRDLALDHFLQAIARAPNQPDAYVDFGIFLQQQRQVDQAIQQYQQAIALAPNWAAAHLNLGMAQLLAGDWDQGWAEYEWRLRCPGFASPLEMIPRWAGEDLTDKTILLQAEQGIGDTFQFLRYLPILNQQGATVIMECSPDLQRLLAGQVGIEGLWQAGEPLPPADYYLPLMSLPFVLHTRLDTIPQICPYLNSPQPPVPESDLRPAVRQVGLVWASNSPQKLYQFSPHQHRNVPLALLQPLRSLTGYQFHSLQVGDAAAELAAIDWPDLVDWRDRLQDWADTAAAIAQLDLVITVDTAVAHLAGAMGKPVWVMLPYSPDWRWLLDRADSPWYPTLRLFRPVQPGDWAGVVTAIYESLASWSKNTTTLTAP